LVTGEDAFRASYQQQPHVGAVVMNEPSSLYQNCHDDSWASEPEAFNLHKRILQTERDQINDEALIDHAITLAENDIAHVQKRQLAFERSQAAIITIRDAKSLV
jgi:hypothetical protein